MNLLSNAIDSFETIGNTRERCITIGASRNQATAILSVSDNGSGIAPEYTDKIFEPFFTTKESKKSIGIGLTTVKRIVGEELKGTITLDTTLGKGTTFQISFPIVEQA